VAGAGQIDQGRVPGLELFHDVDHVDEGNVGVDCLMFMTRGAHRRQPGRALGVAAPLTS
jgi:hypothetical protein